MNEFDPNDPIWTAFLLGELSSEKHEEVKAFLKNSEDAQRTVQELEQTISLLNHEFPQHKLTLLDDQRECILNSRASKPKQLRGLPAAWLSLAALLIVFLATWPVMPWGKVTPLPSPENPSVQILPVVSSQQNALLQTGIKQMEAGDLDAAEQTLEKVLTKDRYNIHALQALKELMEQRIETRILEREKQVSKMFDEVEKRWIYDLDTSDSTPDFLDGQIATGKKDPTDVTRSTETLPTVPTENPDLHADTYVIVHKKRIGRLGAGGGIGGGTFPDGREAPRRLGGMPKQQYEEAQPVISPSQDDFAEIQRNSFKRVSDHPLSTFSIDVDTAAYALMRSRLQQGSLPPKDAIRIEELVNYFDYTYEAPSDGNAFASHMALAPCPWEPEHKLLRIALKGREIPREERPPFNLVFLLDVSGSMDASNKLTLVKSSMKALSKQLNDQDRVAIVVYAGAAGLVLPSTPGNRTAEISTALDRLSAGGSTAGGAGIHLAYTIAQKHFVEDGVNRVILCTDGDFNVGTVQRGDLVDLIEEKAKSGVQLSVLGFGMGNYKDSTLEGLSNKGNGNYAYIDTHQEAHKVLVEDMLGTLVTIAKDVKIQVEFNPAQVAAYRLIGYENRMLKKEDFNNDQVDAGEIGAGHRVTALYQLVPPGGEIPGEAPAVDPLKYNQPPAAGSSTEILTLKLRHKAPGGEISQKQEFVLQGNQWKGNALKTDPEFRFASSVAAFGQWLRDEPFREQMSLEEIASLAKSGLGEDRFGYRNEFLQLIQSANTLTN